MKNNLIKRLLEKKSVKLFREDEESTSYQKKGNIKEPTSICFDGMYFPVRQINNENKYKTRW